jgi:hypothetical protein
MNVKTIAIIISSIIGILGAANSFAVLPYRVEQAEKLIINMQVKSSLDHDLLIKIAQDIEYIKERSR